MTILVPTDLSPLSRVAVFYASSLAKSLNANIVIAMVVNANPTGETLLHTRKLEEEIAAAVREDAEELMREIRESVANPPPVEFHTATGYPLDEVIGRLVKQYDADMIVMGSKGATGLRRILLGSNAVAVINSSTVPVVLIPENVAYAPLKSVVYATDLQDYRDETKNVVAFARLFGAELVLLHVLPRESTRDVDTAGIVGELTGLTDYDKISFETLRSDDIAEALDAFVTRTRTDMLAMFTHHLDFYEKLFGRSVTRRLALHTRVPLLTFNKTTFR